MTFFVITAYKWQNNLPTSCNQLHKVRPICDLLAVNDEIKIIENIFHCLISSFYGSIHQIWKVIC